MGLHLILAVSDSSWGAWTLNLILVLLGLLVGAVALSMFMPLFDLTALAGGG